MSYSPFIFYGLIGLVALVSAFISARLAARRSRAAAAFARQEGFRTFPDVEQAPRGSFDFGFDDTFSDSWSFTPPDGSVTTMGDMIRQIGPALPRNGSGYEVRNLLLKTDGPRDWVIFDFTTISRDSRGRESRSTSGVVAGRIPYAFPWLELRPENVFDRIGHAMGMQEIDFEVEEFNRKYHVSAQDRKFAFDLLSPRAIQQLLRYPARHWHFGGCFVVITSANVFDYFDALRAIQEMADVLDTVEPFLKEQCGIRSGWTPLLTARSSS